MPSLKDFTPKDLNKIADSFARLMPTGNYWSGGYVEDTNFRLFLKGIGKEMTRFQQMVQAVAQEYIPNLTTSAIDEWEQFLGIPDDCFFITSNTTPDERRRNIIIKLAYMNLQTDADYKALAAQFGLIILLEPQGGFVLKIIILNAFIPGFPYTFTFTFGGSTPVEIFECIVTKQKAAHVQVIFETPP